MQEIIKTKLLYKKKLLNRDSEIKNFFKSNFFKHQMFKEDFIDNCKDLNYWKWISDKYDKYLEEKNEIEIVPKIIHQIWIGSKVPKKYSKWRKSWLKYNPQYKYILWDEQKILKIGLINEKLFKQAKNPAIKSDIARYEILYKYGGIYADTDFEALRAIDTKLLSKSFVSCNMFDYKPNIANGFIISEPKFFLFKELLLNLSKYKKNMSPLEILDFSGATYLTKIIFKNKEKLKNIVLLPSKYFYPWPNYLISSKKYRYSYSSEQTIAIHHWEMSWMKDTYFKRLKFFIKNLF